MDTDELIDFIAGAGKLKRLPRTGWVECGVPDPESVADHSFRVALISMVLADERGLDTLKAVRMALLHDLAEVETGDLTPTQKGADPASFKLAEEAAMSKILENLTTKYIEAWREFSDGSSAEANLVRDADKLEMVMQAAEYQGSGGDRMKLMRFWHAEINDVYAKSIRDRIKSRSGYKPQSVSSP